MFFPLSVLPLRIWLVPSHQHLWISASCSQPSETDRACTVTVTNQFKGYKILTFTFHILSSLFPCVWHPFCSTESSWQPSHKQYKCISKPLETSRIYFPVMWWNDTRLVLFTEIISARLCCFWWHVLCLKVKRGADFLQIWVRSSQRLIYDVINKEIGICCCGDR